MEFACLHDNLIFKKSLTDYLMCIILYTIKQQEKTLWKKIGLYGVQKATLFVPFADF